MDRSGKKIPEAINDDVILALEQAADQLKAPLYVKDREGRYLLANLQYRRMAGAGEEDITGATDEQLSISLISPDTERLVLEGEAQIVRSSEECGGTDRVFEFALEPLRQSGGMVKGIAGIGACRYSGVEISRTLLHSRDAADARVILSHIAHDLNNYLYGISGVAALALEAAPDEGSVSSDLNEILKISGKIGGYIKRLQDLSAPDSFASGRESLNDIVAGIAGYLRKEFPADIEIRSEIPGEDCFARVEREEIENAILNICYNAREAIEGNGWISLQLTQRAKITDGREQLFYRIAVKDSGCGMGEEEKERCGELFYSQGKKGEYLGLGFPVAESIIRKHHGEISVNTSPGSGTSVEILLPAD